MGCHIEHLVHARVCGAPNKMPSAQWIFRGRLRIFQKDEWEAHVAELREVYLNIYDSINAGDAPKAQSAARQWMNIIRKRLSSAVSSAPTKDIEVQLHG